MYILQETFFADNNRYGQVDGIGYSLTADGFDGNECENSGGDNEIGFTLSGCENVRYQYESSPENNGQEFIAVAQLPSGVLNSICPGNSEDDVWTIDHNKSLKHASNGLVDC